MADEHISVRLSHLLRHCSVGAIVRGPESLMVVPDIRKWHAPHENPLEGEIRYVDQVRGSLGITQRLCRPPVPHERAGQKTGWIPALRFPAWMRCLKCEWHPAVELYGEGIFFTLDEAVLARWEASSALQERADAFARRYYQSDLQNRASEVSVTPRLLLCHTLAHLLIRQLEAYAGYPGASLKERLYCRGGGVPTHGGPSDGGPMKRSPMAGILIYVAVADEEGSLGGLAELAEPKRFLRLLNGAMEEANWCSLDPVCGEREGHGPGLLNGASCHACALVAETSCEHGNTLLDRTFIKGDGAEIPAFLDCVGDGS